MQILMTDVTGAGAATLAATLQAHGHEIVTCGDERWRPFACAALRGEPCPLEHNDVDVALHVERDGTPPITDAGLLCALRHFVPVVAASADPAASSDPFVPWATRAADSDYLEGALVRAVAAPLVRHGITAERAANSVLASAGLAATWRAVVHRRGRNLRLELASDQPVPLELRSASAVRAADAVRALDPNSRVLDVVVNAERAEPRT